MLKVVCFSGFGSQVTMPVNDPELLVFTMLKYTTDLVLQTQSITVPQAQAPGKGPRTPFNLVRLGERTTGRFYEPFSPGL